MKKNLFCIWLVFAILFSVNTQAQMTIGGKKEPEAFSVLELLNKGGLRLPQMTTAQRNTFAVQGKIAGEGLTIYNIDTKCVEYWNASRWVSLCDGTSQASISPEPCVNVAANGTGCDQTFDVTDPDCPDGLFEIEITRGENYASLSGVNKKDGSFKINFNPNETVNKHNVIVRVTSSCTGLYKEFLFSQNGVDCSTMPYAVPTLSASSSVLCAGGSVYLSVPANTPNLDKLIWIYNGVEIPSNRGLNYLVADKAGKYNISMGAMGCNTNAANEKIIEDSTTSTAPGSITISADNNGVICGTGTIDLFVTSGTATNIAWFHNGVEDKTKSGRKITISGDSSVGQWFAAVKEGSCYSKQSANIITVTKSEAASPIIINDSDVKVNGKPLKDFTAFCAGGTLDLSVVNKQNGITYSWYNGTDKITSNPYKIPDSQTKISLSMIATDDSGAKCPAQQKAIDMDVIQGSTPEIKSIDGNTALCDGEAKLTINPKTAGTYTYMWYKNVELMSGENKDFIIVKQGGDYSAAIANTTGCVSPAIKKTVSNNNSNRPELSWTSFPANDTASFGSKFTFATSTTFPAESYVWTKNGVEVSGQASANGTIDFLETDGERVTVAVTAKNYCGTSDTLEKVITLNNGCPTPEIISQSQLEQTVTGGSDPAVSITLRSGTANQPTYQWYVNKTSASTTGAAAISGATASSYTEQKIAQGDYYYYCIVQNGCTGTPSATSAFFHVKASVDPASITSGSGTLSGKTCFDIAESGSVACGMIDSRSSTRADFNTMSAQEYKFTTNSTASVSNVRFVVVESDSGKIVDLISSDAVTDPTTTIAKGTVVTLKVTYKKTLSSTTLLAKDGTAYGRDDKSALTLTIYAIYNDGPTNNGTDKKVQLTAKIKDCSCCGAKVGPLDSDWRVFLCHNLGADTSVDPLDNNQRVKLVGDYYHWGMSSPVNPLIINPIASPAGSWSNTGNIKGPNDPCPEGYRVPTSAEWAALYNSNNNVLRYAGVKNMMVLSSDAAFYFGDYLMLPYTGVKQYSNSNPPQSTQHYWSGTGSNGSGKLSTAYLMIDSYLPTFTGTEGSTSYVSGLPVRCIAKKDGEGGKP
ncbi:uncharacterized protein (TIGR02145 family) [Flavobacterium sp. 2755]|uniref:FISUMP domain-containing protein n=1 Tax=Flavobacterium sp. 2755 TaxID=2817765 RepID=UPI002865499E|nr:FISUMP domain-containing protein [Flavobacterium sp. 2755]MDR6762795.1 uncharacterized protein (TIGR02145 family) [Flavobacterium sp. 2755]